MRRLKALSAPKERYQKSSFLLEGSNLLKEALKTSSLPSEIIATPEWIEKHLEIMECLPESVRLHLVSKSVLKASLTTVNPDGVASLLSLDSLPKVNDKADFILALDRLQDPGNLGTLFRTALAAEVEDVWLAMGADPLSQKVLRSSAGAIFHLPFQRLGNSEEDAVNELFTKLKMAKDRGFQIVGTYGPGAHAITRVSPYWEINWSEPTILVLGNEGSGLHPKIQASCTHAVTLPHNVLVESLNVASAAVPLLLERLRAKMTS